MESKILIEIAKRVEKGEKSALIILTEIEGSSPGKKGSIMGVFQEGKILGTVGGGNLEYTLIKEALLALEKEENREIKFQLIEEAALHMKCGGQVSAFIKIFAPKPRILIVGGGHVGSEIVKLGSFLEMETVVFDDREEFCNLEKFPNSQCILGDVGTELERYETKEGDFLVIVSRGHLQDKSALREGLKKTLKYIGMIGSRKKILETYKELLNEGFSKESLEKVYAPMGMDISDGTPKEIALGVLAEILKVKNSSTGEHMKTVKKIIF